MASASARCAAARNFPSTRRVRTSWKSCEQSRESADHTATSSTPRVKSLVTPNYPQCNHLKTTWRSNSSSGCIRRTWSNCSRNKLERDLERMLRSSHVTSWASAAFREEIWTGERTPAASGWASPTIRPSARASASRTRSRRSLWSVLTHPAIRRLLSPRFWRTSNTNTPKFLGTTWTGVISWSSLAMLLW